MKNDPKGVVESAAGGTDKHGPSLTPSGSRLIGLLTRGVADAAQPRAKIPYSFGVKKPNQIRESLFSD